MYLLGRKYYIKWKELIIFYTNANNTHILRVPSALWLNNYFPGNNNAKANFMTANYYNVL